MFFFTITIVDIKVKYLILIITIIIYLTQDFELYTLIDNEKFYQQKHEKLKE